MHEKLVFHNRPQLVLVTSNSSISSWNEVTNHVAPSLTRDLTMLPPKPINASWTIVWLFQKCSYLGAVHKRNLHKITKNWPPSPLVRTGSPPLSVRTHYKFQKILKFFVPKSADVRNLKKPPLPLSAKCPHCTNPLLPTADVFYGRPLTFLQSKLSIVLLRKFFSFSAQQKVEF